MHGICVFLQSIIKQTNAIKIDELTLSIVCTKYPKKMIEYPGKKKR